MARLKPGVTLEQAREQLKASRAAARDIAVAAAVPEDR
jgi:hypothetical protein